MNDHRQAIYGMNTPTTLSVESHVDEIKLKDPSSNYSKATSLAKALKKRISLGRLSPKPTNEPEVDGFKYPTVTIEDWEEMGGAPRYAKDEIPYKEAHFRSDGDTTTDVGESDDDGMTDSEDHSNKLQVLGDFSPSDRPCGGVRFFKRLSLCDMKEGQNADPKERVFLEAAERGDKHTMMRCLASPNPVNVNCTDILGRSAIQMAVDNENVEIVELLLQQESVRIGDALLYAITEGVYKIVEMLIDHASITAEMLANDWNKVRTGGEESSDFDPNISPIILAAHCNQFEILQLFLSRGAYIETPHSLSCNCMQCKEGLQVDSLRYSLKRIHTYRALSSPAWISLTSEDPILAAFKVIAVLNRRSDDSDDSEEDDNDDDPSKLTLSRLKLALKYDQKQFVAHPNCQQLLTSVWHEGLPVWRRGNAVVKIFLCSAIIICMPVIALTYLLLPRTKLGRVIRSPFMKFIYHSASFGIFLVLLILASTRAESSEVNRRNIRGPLPTMVEWLIFFWVSGMVWSECKQLWEEGLQAYIRQWWNWLDFIMLSLYLCTFSLRAVAFVQVSTNKYGPKEIPRAQWPSTDPTLISEGVFAVANVFSFARIIYLFQTNPHLGPLQISLGCMIIDIAKFLFIFFLVLTSFACGLNQLYSYYGDPVSTCRSSSGDIETCPPYSAKEGNEMGSFRNLDVTFSTLFWSLFGISSPKTTDLVEDHAFIEAVGQGLFMAYHVMSIIVLINMLIAMMSNSFQQIEDHADREWKFARSQLWMSYFDPGSTLPPPFNLIISPKSIYYLLKAIKDAFCSVCCPARKRRKKAKAAKLQAFTEENHNFFLKGPNASNKSRQTRRYADVMRRLVSRYIHQAKKQHRQDGVNEDDLLEIKQDISSLRYELREDRKREAARAYGQMDSIKKDILRLVKQHNKNTTQIYHPPPYRLQHQLSTDTLSPYETLGAGSFQPSSCNAFGPQALLTPESKEASTAGSGRVTRGMLHQQQSVDLGMLGRDPNTPPAVDITVTPASSLPTTFTYSQGNLSGCLLAPQEMDYLRKEIVRSLRVELRNMLREALSNALTPSSANIPGPQCYPATPTPSTTPIPTSTLAENSPMHSNNPECSNSLDSNSQGGHSKRKRTCGNDSAVLKVPLYHAHSSSNPTTTVGSQSFRSLPNPMLLQPVPERLGFTFEKRRVSVIAEVPQPD